MRVAGLISGTSVDGIDVAVVDIGEGVHVVTTATVPYPRGVREAILSVSNAATHTMVVMVTATLALEGAKRFNRPNATGNSFSRLNANT